MKGRRINIMKHFAILIIMLLHAVPLGAQPNIELRKLRPHSPDYYYYHLYFTATCNGQTLFDLDRRQLILKEDGALVDTNRYKIDRLPDPERNSCFEAVLAFDNSAQVSADILQQMVEGGRQFIQRMDQDCQRASILTFSKEVAFREFLSKDKDLLFQALLGMTPSGYRALRDAIYAGYLEFYTNGIMRVQPLILVTTGGDQGSLRTQSDLLAVLLKTDVRVFIVNIGPEQGTEELKSLAYETGGSYFQLHSPAELPTTMDWLAGYVRREYDEFRLIRSTHAVNQSVFPISMRLEACADSIWADRIFRLDADPTAAEEAPAPRQVELGQAYPHPLSLAGGPGTIEFTLPPSPASSTATLTVYDMLGRKVMTLFDGQGNDGSNRIQFDPSALTPGVYVYMLRAGLQTLSRRMVIVH